MAFTPSCAWPEVEHDEASAPSIFDSIIAKHLDIIRVTIHAVPTRESTSQIIACNLRERIGQLTGPEDRTAISSGNATVLEEGQYLDYTVVIRDVAGRPIAATSM